MKNFANKKVREEVTSRDESGGSKEYIKLKGDSKNYILIHSFLEGKGKNKNLSVPCEEVVDHTIPIGNKKTVWISCPADIEAENIFEKQKECMVCHRAVNHYNEMKDFKEEGDFDSADDSKKRGNTLQPKNGTYFNAMVIPMVKEKEKGKSKKVLVPDYDELEPEWKKLKLSISQDKELTKVFDENFVKDDGSVDNDFINAVICFEKNGNKYECSFVGIFPELSKKVAKCEPLDITKEHNPPKEEELEKIMEKYEAFINGEEIEEDEESEGFSSVDFSSMNKKDLALFMKENEIKIKGWKTAPIKKLREKVKEKYEEILEELDDDDFEFEDE